MPTPMGLTLAQANAGLDGIESKLPKRRLAEFREARKALRKAGAGPLEILTMIDLIMKLLDLTKPLVERIAEIIEAWRNR